MFENIVLGNFVGDSTRHLAVRNLIISVRLLVW